MRSLIVIAIAAALTACSTQPEIAAAPAAAPAHAEVKKAPQCWSGDAGKFFDVGARETVSGVAVECKLTADGKAASWVGAKR
jgi:hypothetical protein